MNIYNENKKYWSQVHMMGCLHMHMLKNVSLHVIAVSITLSLFGSFVRCFYLAMLFGSFIRCFHLAIYASTLVTLIFVLTLRVTSLDSRPKDDKVHQLAVPKVQSVSILGGPKFQKGSKYFCRIWTGGPTTTVVQILRDSAIFT